jgi:hypothetical protein
MSRRFFLFVLALVVALPLAQFFVPTVAHAAASLSVGGPTGIKIGDTVNITVSVNTGGQSANAFQANFSYPSGLFEAVRGTYSGSICTLPITQPEPDGGAASFSCGRPSGFNGTGTVVTIVLKAVSAGSGSFGLSGCQVLANDGQGTDISGGCSGRGVTVAESAAAIATPTPTPTPTPQQQSSGGTTTSSTPKPTATPKASATPTATPKNTPTPTPSQTPVAAETPKEVEATPEPTAPPVQSLAPTTPTPEVTSQPQQTTTDEGTRQPRTIGQAIQDILASSKDLKNLHSSPAGVIALMVTTIPFLALTLAILFLAFRLYTMERRRRNTLDRLFEMELSELAALEGKLDLLAEKVTKGREQYREEFKHAKENILRQLKPNFGKALDPDSKPAEPPAAAPEKK